MTAPPVFFVYWIRSGASNYIGATVDPKRRLRQHNREIKGGARRTGGKVWTFHLLFFGFRTWIEALQFEWALKYAFRRCRSLQARTEALDALLSKVRWTRNSPPAKEVPLIVVDQDDMSFALD